MSVKSVPRLVGGEWRLPTGGRTLDVVDPADTRRVVARIPAMTAPEVTELYDRAAEASAGWAALSPLDRAAVMGRAARTLRERHEEIAADLVAEMGKTRAEAEGEVEKAADFFDYYAGFARRPWGELLADGRPGTRTSVRREPVGVVLLVTPWNDPLLTPARKLAPALIAGNTVVLKPATQTPLVSLHLARALHDSGLPAGVLGVAVGSIRQIEEALLDDVRLDAVSFTGSTPVGRSLQRRLAGRNVRLQTELGGKNASAVLADADLDLAVRTIASAAFGQTGQRCTATSRVVVDRAVAEQVVSGLVAQADALRVGPGEEKDTVIGPLADPGHRDSVLEHITRAAAQGAGIAAGGAAPEGEEYAHGCYVRPTVLVGVDRDMDIWREEVFGPVIAVQVVDGFDAAVEAVNDSVYGLSSAVFTRDLRQAEAFSDRVRTGQVSVNLPTMGWDVHMPFGGFGDSGSPFKEQGSEALNFYTRVKTVAVRYDTGA